ncbi:hypothetical protein [Archangium violaceum]|uniref:hypothetical protein n=1 Tax=Archangium violaceum TaxID=83451 RepID=UPI003D274C2C
MPSATEPAGMIAYLLGLTAALAARRRRRLRQAHVSLLRPPSPARAIVRGIASRSARPRRLAVAPPRPKP